MDAVTPDPAMEAGDEDTSDHGDSDSVDGVEETKTELPPTSPTVEPDPAAAKPDPPAVEEPDSSAEDPADPEEPAVETVAPRTARRQIATQNMGPEDDIPRRYGRARAQTRILERDALSVVRDNAFEVAWKPPVMIGRMDDSSDDRVQRDSEDGTQAFYALLAEDQSNLQPDGPIGKHWSLVEDEPQSYRAACDSVHRDIWLGAMRQEFKGLMDNNTFDIAELLAGRKPISGKWVFV